MTDKMYRSCSLKRCTIVHFELLLDLILYQLTELLKDTNEEDHGVVKCTGLKNYTYR